MSYSRFGNLAFESVRPPPTDAEIARIVAEIGAYLPPSFLEFIQVANGAYINDYVIDVPLQNGKSEAISFCSIFNCAGHTEPGSFLGEIRMSRDNQAMPRGMLPIARDGGGSVVFLDLTPAGGGRVIAFIHGLPAWAGLRTESQFVELATSFEEYLGKLRVDRESVVESLALDARSIEHVVATEHFLDIGVPLWRDDAALNTAVTEARLRITGGKQ